MAGFNATMELFFAVIYNEAIGLFFFVTGSGFSWHRLLCHSLHRSGQ